MSATDAPARVLPRPAIETYLREVSLLLNLSALDSLTFDESVSLLRVAHDRLKDVTSVAEYSRPRPRILFLNASGLVVDPKQISPAVNAKKRTSTAKSSSSKRAKP